MRERIVWRLVNTRGCNSKKLVFEAMGAAYKRTLKRVVLVRCGIYRVPLGIIT